jgi:hypothetical protein
LNERTVGGQFFIATAVQSEYLSYYSAVFLFLRGGIGVLAEYACLFSASIVDIEYDFEQGQDCSHLLPLSFAVLPSRHYHQLHVILRQFVQAQSLQLPVVYSSREYPPRWEDDYGVAAELASHPLSQAEEEVFIDKEAHAVRQLIAGLALEAAIPEINHWEHSNRYKGGKDGLNLFVKRDTIAIKSSNLFQIWQP